MALSEETQNNFNDALQFIKDFRNSDNFKQILNDHISSLSRSLNKYDRERASRINTDDFEDWMYPTLDEFDYPRVAYNTQDNTVYATDDEDWYKQAQEYTGISDKDAIFSHELGHFINEFMGFNNDYVDSYSLLKNNSKFQDLYREASPNLQSIMNRDPSLGVNSFYDNDHNPSDVHDADPGESYSDLMLARYLAQKYGIYDSIKGGEFTQEHLDALKKIIPNFRLFQLFPDFITVKMFNTIADNGRTTNQYNDVSYAKRGIKLIPRKKNGYNI